VLASVGPGAVFRGNHLRTDDAEAAYLQERVRISLDMARTAACSCARLAHRSLAKRYEQELAGIRPTVLPS
jgi:hypothetical protein